MSSDWYTTVKGVADRLAYSAKSSYAQIHDSLSDLTTGIDSSVFNVTSRPTIFTPAAPPPPPQTQWEQVSTWVAENKYAITGVTIASGVGAYFIYKAHVKKHRRRRAARTGNASRKEVLIITNFSSNNHSKAVALDLERRGFIVFCACQTPLEKLAIENEGHADIRPLLVENGDSAYQAVERFGNYLSLPAPAYHGGHSLHFAGLILTPPANLATGPLEVIESAQMSHALEVGVSWPTTMLQYFLPLLREHSGRVLFLNDWIIPALHTPFYTPAVLTSHAVEALATTLSREIPSLFIVHLKLGTFDLAHHHQPKNAVRADVLGWSPSLRAAYSSSYKNCTIRPMNARVRGSPMKDLHHAVFDALTDANPARHVSVGAGVNLYQWIAQYLPEIGLQYLLGTNVTGEDKDWEVLDH